jgi:hypothetical protein
MFQLNGYTNITIASLRNQKESGEADEMIADEVLTKDSG